MAFAGAFLGIGAAPFHCEEALEHHQEE
jgi:hypothetical protein